MKTREKRFDYDEKKTEQTSERKIEPAISYGHIKWVKLKVKAKTENKPKSKEEILFGRFVKITPDQKSKNNK